MKKISEKSIERLILYRRILGNLLTENQSKIFSHQLSRLTDVTSAQIRRDLMVTGYSGSPVHGYDVEALLKSICDYIDTPGDQGVAIFGLGHLGRSVMGYFNTRQPRLKIKAAFDTDPDKVNRVLHGIRCYRTDQAKDIIETQNISVGILAVPQRIAQDVATLMVNSGITGILNYAPTRLELPPQIYVENRDMILAVEKVAYYSKKNNT
ncbi:redox-sensing transcriptional repressor Rex [bacterium]|nr:redox-sensing transcriptional repressor Rex [bacterium]